MYSLIPEARHSNSSPIELPTVMKTLLSFLFVFSTLSLSHACPLISGVVDFNCDEKLTMSFMGDSVAYGFGDTKNGNKGGYVLRISKKLPGATIDNLGELGAHSGPYLRDYLAEFKKDELTNKVKSLLQSDIVVLDLGRNDRWEFGLPSATYRNLQRLAKAIRSEAKTRFGSAPMVIIADIMLPNRGSQGPWVKELNGIILKGSNSTIPGNLRFDLVSKRLLNSDQIHPSSLGYDALAKAFLAYLKTPLTPLMKKQRPDLDDDGIYDLFEESLFRTSPELADTDGDGVKDGKEVFVDGTDPVA